MLIDLAGLAPIFSCAGPFTALIPTNEAFNSLDPAVIKLLTNPANIKELQNFILYSILPGATLSMKFTAGPTATLFAGNQVNISLNPLQFNGVGPSRTNIMACNGYIDILSGVLNPFNKNGKSSSARPDFLLNA
jgi:uncharacterized surface protein with fasciclin (FAS1) repeats